MKTIMLKRYRLCHCDHCERSRKFKSITEKLPKKDRKWVDGIFDYMLDLETELYMINAAKVICFLKKGSN